jgi:DoxX-like family
MNYKSAHKFLSFCIAAIWIANGLFCKILNLVPRHELIVAKILGNEYSRTWTMIIGCAETLMAIWVLSGHRSRLNAITQIFIIAAMNILELIFVPDMLLWGKANGIFAFILIFAIYFNEFYLNKKSVQQT